MGWLLLGQVSAAVFACMAITACVSSSAPPITKIEARSWSSDRVEQRTAEQLADVLVLQEYPKSKNRPIAVLTDLWFDVGPRASGVQGVCEKEVVKVEFDRASDPHPNSETLTRASWLSSETQYRIIDPPLEKSSANSDEDWTWLSEACAKLSRDDPSFFAASDAATALRAVVWLKRIFLGVRSDRPDFSLVCEDEVGCRKWIEQMGLPTIWHVQTCARDPEKDECLVITTYGTRFNIFGPARDGSPGSTTVEMQELVIIADQRID